MDSRSRKPSDKPDGASAGASDGELDGDSVEANRASEAAVSAPSAAEDGALDMLCKSHHVPLPPDGYFDGLWPSVDQRLDDKDGGAPSGSNGSAPPKKRKTTEIEQELVFKSSPALSMLKLPERARTPTGAMAAASPAPETTAAPVAPPPQATSLRWPVTFVLVAAIATGGFILYKRMNPQSPIRDGAPEAKLGAAGGAPASAPASAPAATGDPAAGTGTPAGAVAQKTDDKAEAKPEEKTAAKGGQEPDDKAEGKSEHRGASEGKKKEKGRAGGTRVASAGKSQDKSEKSEDDKPKATPKTDEPAKPAAAKKGKKSDALDNLIDDVIGPTKKAPKKEKKTDDGEADLPEQLTMNQIRSAMSKVKGNVGACYDKFQVEGTATVKVVVAGGGGVRSVEIKGKFFGTDTGSCVVAAVKRARFPKFRASQMEFSYPFLLQ